MKKKKIAVGYIRVSTEEQAKDGYSLDNQQTVIKKKCNYEEWEVKEIFHDKGVSGASIDKREGIKALLKYVKSNDVDYLVVYKVSRLSRKISDVVAISDYLEKSGVKLIAIEDNIDTSTPMGKYFLVFGAIFAEMERENIITQVKGGMQQKAREGEWNGGSPPIGYDLLDKKLRVNEAEANIVITVFNEYLKGSGYKTIASLLNEKGYKTKKGKNFNGVGIKQILKNPTYCGLVRWGHRKDWSKLHEDNKRKRKYSDDPIVSAGVHEAIIRKEIFDSVQNLIIKNPRHHVKQFNGNHLLSGLLRCPECGYGMSMQLVNNKGKIYEYYTCNQYQTYKRCKSNSIKKDDIEKEFLGIFYSALNKPEVLKTMLNSLNNRNQTNMESLNAIKLRENELKKLRIKESKLTDELIEGNENYKSTIRRKIQEISDEIVVFENDIMVLKNSLEQTNSLKLDTNEITELLGKVSKVIPLLEKQVQQSLIRKLITSIKVENKRILEVRFSFKEGIRLGDEGDSDESPSDTRSFRVQSDTVNRIISNCCMAELATLNI
ncbi:recombinase family protein [Fictibacillus sp. UD]|uniref:recombinase family protein n=1 Tax=Fictibacillus sp. UD TaxID=3038777 RepID=UPI003746876A